VILRVPFRLPVEVGVNVTDKVHDPPAARLVPQLWLTAKSPVAAIEVKFRTAVPEFVSFTVWAALVLPTVSAANVRLVGESVTAGAVTTGASPVPVNNTVCGEPIALSVTLTVPVLLPAAVGVNVTESMQDPPPAMLVPQLWLTAKSPEAAIEVRFKTALPEFVSVTVCAELVVSVVCDAKVSAVGARVTIGAVATPVPERVTVWGEPVALSVTVSAPVRVPATEGVKLTEMVQLPPTATLVPQV
jgi:hypothetical protein